MAVPFTRTIVCLANSRKPPSGRCVAGRELIGSAFGDWIRPVSARPTREISVEERRYSDGRDPRVLDIIALELLGEQPEHHQKENHLMDVDRCWVKQGTMTWRDLLPAVEDPAGPLWPNGYSSYDGQNDRVPGAFVDDLPRSLFLIRPQGLRLVVAAESRDLGPPRRRVRAQFKQCGQPYRLVVTDPWIENILLAKRDREYAVAEALLCVSLGELFHGFAYKLAAAVITPKRAGA